MSPSRVAVITDSASALTVEVCAALGVSLVPLRVVVDGEDRADTALDNEWFYDRLAAGARVTTSQPAPADLLAAYQRAAAGGAEAAWSVHLGSGLSGTLNAAAVAAGMAPIPVRLVDTGTASMPQGLCVLAAVGEVLRNPGTDVAAVVAAEAAAQENIFVSLTPGHLERSGRAGTRFDVDLPVLSLRSGRSVEVVGAATDMNDALARMVAQLERIEGNVTVAVGGGGAGPWADALLAAVRQTPAGSSAVSYRVPPSMGAHAGPTLGLVISRAAFPAMVLDAMSAGPPGKTAA